MTKKDTKSTAAAQGFEVEQIADNPEVAVQDAEMVDEQPEAEPIKPKGISLYIDLEHDPEKEPEKNTTTSIGFVLNEKAISLTTIADKIAEYDKIVIDGFLDKKNYELVKKAKSDLLKTRTTLNKVAKADVIDPINKWLTDYKGGLKEVSDALLAGQEKMEAKIKAIDDAFELEQQRKEKEAQDRIQGRASGLANFGAIFNAEQGLYTFPYDAGLVINSLNLKDWEDIEYQEFIDQVVESWNTEQLRVQEEERLEAEEKQRILDLNSQLTDREKAVQEKQIKLRSKELSLMGASVDEDVWTLGDTAISLEDITTLSDDAWELLIDKLGNAMDGIVEGIEDDTAAFYGGMGFDIEGDDSGSQIAIDGNAGFAPAPEELAPFESAIKSGPETKIAFFEPQLESVTVTTEAVEQGVFVQIMFNEDKPFIIHNFQKSTMRIFPSQYEYEANDGVAPADIIDAGMLSETELQYLLIKKPK